MFTGLIERTGRIARIKSNSVSVEAGEGFSAVVGDSVAVNGVCLTVTSISGGVLEFDVSHETISVTNLANMKSGDYVNLELPLRADGRFHGHMVLGHVDTVGSVIRLDKKKDTTDIIIGFKEEFCKWVASKASIAVNGVSLTVNDLPDRASLRLTLIPHTLQKTNISGLAAGSPVNLEFDILAKYLESLLAVKEPSGATNVTDDFLRRMGYGA